MAIRQLRYQEDEILRKKCKKVAQVDDKIRIPFSKADADFLYRKIFWNSFRLNILLFHN